MNKEFRLNVLSASEQIAGEQRRLGARAEEEKSYRFHMIKIYWIQ